MFKVGDKVVYPMHGAGVIEGIEEKEILGKSQRYYILRLPTKNMKVMLPTDNVENLGLRDVVSEKTVIIWKKLNPVIYSMLPRLCATLRLWIVNAACRLANARC